MATESVSERGPSALEERYFMTGKALVSAMGLEVESIDGRDDDTCVIAGHRHDTKLIPQNNFTRKYLQALLARPELLEGFSAALTTLLADGYEIGAGIAESIGAASYEACTKCMGPEAEMYTEPTVDEQLRSFGLDDLAKNLPEVSHG